MYATVTLLFALLNHHIWLVLVAIVTGLVYRRLRRSPSLPPGPDGYLILGYIPYLRTDAHKKLAALSKTYGPLFGLRLGLNDVVIINGWSAAKEALFSESFLDRPNKNIFNLFSAENLVTYNGQLWRNQRRVALRLLRNVGFGKSSMEQKIADEISYMCTEIEKRGKMPIHIKNYVAPIASNIVAILVMGQRWDYSHPTRQLLDIIFDYSGSEFDFCSYSSHFPRVIKFIAGMQKDVKWKNISEKYAKFLRDQYEEHSEKYDKDDIKDFMDGYIAEIKAGRPTFDSDHLTGTAKNLFGAGSDTVRTVVEWSYLYLALHQDVQAKIHSELNASVGGDRAPQFADRESTPYTMAFIYEILRMFAMVPINLPRVATEDVTITGIKIKKGTQLLVNTWAVQRDPAFWVNPDSFMPERFLNEDQTKFEGSRREAFIPFSYGKRACPGESLAIMELYFFIVIIMQRYTLTIPDGLELTLEEVWSGISIVPKVAPSLHFNRRNPQRLLTDI